MTYSIIPPLLVVLSLIGIILFLIKKAPQVALLSKERQEGSEPRRKFLGKITSSVSQGSQGTFKHRFLIFLEKVTRKLKVLFLKLENTFNSWNESLRNKRKKNSFSGENELGGEKFSPYEEKLEIYNEKKQQEINMQFRRTSGREFVRKGLAEPLERAPQSMVSKKVMPKAKAEIKDRFEHILIDRIAANPKDIEAYERLGEYYMEIENFEYAKECFKQVIKLDSTNNSAKSRMRRLERLLGK